MKSFAKHLPHYILLFGLLLAGFSGLVLFSYDKNFQIAIALGLSLSYVSWGVVHHIIHKDFHLEVLFEYVAMAILGFIIIFSLIIRT